MKIPFAMTAFALAFFTMGCNNDHGSAGADQNHADVHDQKDHGHAQAQSEIPKVELDKGKRWVANSETTEGIANMSTLIDTYDPASGDPQILKAGLEEEFALIFERCTMTGEAHDQLHNYLLPMHQDMKEIDLSEASERDELRAYLDTYRNYFE